MRGSRDASFAMDIAHCHVLEVPVAFVVGEWIEDRIKDRIRK